jgi:ubiquitin-activating enzyme E1 C
MTGFRDLHVIDMDTIDLSNLNRQFLFRPRDVGRPKAVVAAECIKARVPGCCVTPHYCKIQDKDARFYFSFNIIICGLDSMEARRWLNATIVSVPKRMVTCIRAGGLAWLRRQQPTSHVDRASTHRRWH